MKSIGVVTSSRADYGILKHLIQELNMESYFNVSLIVTGAHLSESFGKTISEIEQDKNTIAKKIAIMGFEKDESTSIIMSNAMVEFGKYFDKNRLDLIILLGDRYEIFAVAIAAVNAKVPIAHLHGGETTIGAIDELYRHAITKLSCLHFTSTKKYRERVIQLGESPEKVFNVGALGVENAKKAIGCSGFKAKEYLSIDSNKPFILVTYHAETLSNFSPEEQITSLLEAFGSFSDMSFVFTKANADEGGVIINDSIKKAVALHPDWYYFDSLGTPYYQLVAQQSVAVVGNSSSGIIEIPTLKVPTINIGDRQYGRIQANSIINCLCKKDSIINAIQKASTKEFKDVVANAINPYEGSATSKQISKIIKDMLLQNKVSVKKNFYDMDG